MFWEFGIVSSEIEDILDKEGESTLESLLNESDLLQEINSKNTRLIDYCSRQDVINKLFSYAIYDPVESIDELSRYKYPMICSEILTAGIASFDHAILDDTNYFMRLFEAFNQDTINILMCNFMVKLFVYFSTEYSEKMYDFIISHNIEIIDIFLKHIQYASICDAILKLQSHELTTDMRAIFIELMYEQNIIGKLYRLITYENSNDIKSAACNLFVEIIRIHRIRPTLFLDNFKYTENMILVEQAQSDPLLQLLLDNMFAYTTTTNKDCKDVDAGQQWPATTHIDKTINYGCIMLLSLFDTTRINDSYGDEFNEFGYIRNTILTVVATDFVLLSNYLVKFVNYLHDTVSAKIKLNSTNTPIPFGTTNINIVRLLSILTIFQCETIEMALIKSDLFKILWQHLPYFSRNNALHGLLFETTTFILLSDIYKNSPTSIAQNNVPKESVLAHLKMKYDFAHPKPSHRSSSSSSSSAAPATTATTTTTTTTTNSNNISTSCQKEDSNFIFGQSTLLYDYLIHDIQLLLVLLKLHETCCYTVKCDFRGHLMQLVSRLSKLPSTSLIPNNPDLSIVPSFCNNNNGGDPNNNNDDDDNNKSNNDDVDVKQKWEFFCDTTVAQYRKDNEIDPNVYTANTFHEDHLDSLFRSFDSNYTQTNDDQNGTFSIFNSGGGGNNNYNNGIDGDTIALQANVKLEVEQGTAYMDSIKQSLLFGADNIKFPSQIINGSKNAFICSSEDDILDEDCFDNEDRLPALNMVIPSSFNALYYLNGEDIQENPFDEEDIMANIVEQPEHVEKSNDSVEGFQKNNDKTTKINFMDRMQNPYVNTFEFGEKNNQYIESVLRDRVSKRLECEPDSDVYTSNITPNLSCNSIVNECSSSSLSTLIDVDHVSTENNVQIVDSVFNTKLPNQSPLLLPNNPPSRQPYSPASKSLSYLSDSDVFYSLTSSVSEVEECGMDRLAAAAAAMLDRDPNVSAEQCTTTSSLTDNIFQNDSNNILPTSSFDSENVEEHGRDRKGTSSPLKLSLSYNSEECDTFDASNPNSNSSTTTNIHDSVDDDKLNENHEKN